ncbi:hypothetical protein C4580_00595 [Candidatus Woesearchaeota archaeon]|nr:MAG: hypothetical protein C4580_00595 [Candidatus Woesearchaeota archaeon]
MVKKVIVGILLAIALVVLVILAAQKQPEYRTIPIPPPPTYDGQQTEQPSPRIDVSPETGTPTPRAPEIEPKQPGIPASEVFPQEVNFWVNNILVPSNQDYDSGRFIRVEDDDIKTFAGSFGPYFDDPRDHLRVELCSELSRGIGAISCEIVPLNFGDRYVSFAKGYVFDEYIGGTAAKDYYAYYIVYVGDTKVAQSNRGAVRTVRAS